MNRHVLKIVLVGIAMTGFQGLATSQRMNPNKPASEQVYKYDTLGTRLVGTLIERQVYGAPGYGETPARDAKETILILKLQSSIAVEPAADAESKNSPNLDAAKNIHELQLFIAHDQQADARKLIGRQVRATGTLNEAVTASQHTQVWMYVTALAER